jgi:hypothetical protein
VRQGAHRQRACEYDGLVISSLMTDVFLVYSCFYGCNAYLILVMPSNFCDHVASDWQVYLYSSFCEAIRATLPFYPALRHIFECTIPIQLTSPRIVSQLEAVGSVLVS